MAAMAFVLGQAVDRLLPQTRRRRATTEAVGELLDRAETGTDEGGSEIDRPTPNTPLEYPDAVFSVLFRPTILEAGRPATSSPRSRRRPRRALVRRVVEAPAQPAGDGVPAAYVLFCIVYTGIFAFAWSSFANLGALARQRVQVWPFVLLLLALPMVQARRPGPVERPGMFTRRPEVVVP